MDSIIVKGKNKQEAVQKALKQLNTTMDNVEIEVIDKKEKHLLKFLSPQVTVKISRKKEEETLPSNEQNPESVGMAWVKGGVVYFNTAEDVAPSIMPCDGLVIRKNRQVIQEEVSLQHGDEVTIEGTANGVEGTFEIFIDDKKLSAHIAVTPGYREEMTPIDCPPTNRLIPKVKRSRYFQKTIQIEDVLSLMKEKGIIYGINKAVIEQACLLEKPGELEIAKGLAVKEGKDGHLKFLMNLESHNLKPKERPDGTVDFREVRRIPTVNQGEVIAVIVPPFEGQAGKTVTGDTIDPAPVNHATVKGNGIQVDGERIIAMKTGTPNVRIRKHSAVINIVEKFIHNDNVNIESGNLSFVGDVEIMGDVEETMQVKANGKVLVHGNIIGANMTCGTALVVNKNVVRSKLVIGINDEQILTLCKRSSKLLQGVKTFRVTLQQLLRAQKQQTTNKNIEFSMIVRTLIQQKFTSMQKQVTSFAKDVNSKESPLMDDARKTAHLLYHTFISFDREVLKDENVFLEMEKQLLMLEAFCETELQPFASATFASVQQSDIFCNGDIYLVGKGVYNSKIEAKGKVHSQGFVRGGNIYAEGSIFANKVGSVSGVKTVLTVPKGEKIIINHVMEDSMIEIGNRSHIFNTEQRNVSAYLDDEGELIL